MTNDFSLMCTFLICINVLSEFKIRQGAQSVKRNLPQNLL